MNSPVAAADSTSDDSISIEEGDKGSCQKLRKLFKVKEGQDNIYEFDSRIGLNGSQIHSTFPCLLDAENKRFYIWLGDITINKFTKSTFMNLANFAESKGAKSMVFVLLRDHCQKDDFKRMFKVLDGRRVGKKGMKQMMNEEDLHSYMKKYALYSIDLE